MTATLTELHRTAKKVMRPVAAGRTVTITDHGQTVAKISPDFPRVTMTPEEFRRLPISDAELDEAINEALQEVRA